MCVCMYILHSKTWNLIYNTFLHDEKKHDIKVSKHSNLVTS